MAETPVLTVSLYGKPIGTLTFIQGERTLFAFADDYINDKKRPTLSISFKDAAGELVTDMPATRLRIPPFFSNMLPEGEMRDYLAKRAEVNSKREFFLIGVLGQDLPGAVTIKPADGDTWPPITPEKDASSTKTPKHQADVLRFSLAGVQLKFSAIKSASGGLTIPADGAGGSWIVKLPSIKYEGVPENEFSMMKLASIIGMNVPEVKLIDVQSIEGLPKEVSSLKGKALAVKRFDRTPDGLVHMEDFAQVFRVYPDDKYESASFRNIAEVIGIETGNDGTAEFIRRLVYNTLIGNADMHLKNWSLIYPNRRDAALSPAYDFVSTIHYLPDDNAALKYARTRRMDQFSSDELSYLAGKALLPEKLVLEIAKETVGLFYEKWRSEQKNLPLSKAMIKAIDDHVKKIPIAAGKH